MELYEIVEGLGLGNVRTRNLLEFSKDWCRYGRARRRTAESIESLPGCGRYAADSWSIFIEGRRYSVRPVDRRLREYLKHERDKRA
jgi:endonuclease III